MSLYSTLILCVFLVGYLLPVILTAASKKVTGIEKLSWVIVVLFSAWIGFLVFLVATTIAANKSTPVDQA